MRRKRNRGIIPPLPSPSPPLFLPLSQFFGQPIQKAKKGSKVVFLSVNVCYIGYLREIDQRKKTKEKRSIDEKE